jgi:hypothetical protein
MFVYLSSFPPSLIVDGEGVNAGVMEAQANRSIDQAKKSHCKKWYLVYLIFGGDAGKRADWTRWWFRSRSRDHISSPIYPVPRTLVANIRGLHQMMIENTVSTFTWQYWLQIIYKMFEHGAKRPLIICLFKFQHRFNSPISYHRLIDTAHQKPWVTQKWKKLH